jgi:hypothetical protein
MKTYALIGLAFMSVMVILLLPSAKLPIEETVEIGGSAEQYHQNDISSLETLIHSQHRRPSEIVFPAGIHVSFPGLQRIEPIPQGVTATERAVNRILDHSVNLKGSPQAGSVSQKGGVIILK